MRMMRAQGRRAGGIALLLMLPFVAPAQQELGMTITGDETTELGLFIAKWLDERGLQPPAPGLHMEPLEPLDPWVLDMRRRIDQVAPPQRPLAAR